MARTYVHPGDGIDVDRSRWRSGERRTTNDRVPSLAWLSGIPTVAA